MFYDYRQNNSGGNFTLPAVTVIVEADNAQEADYIAEDLGLYWDGVRLEIDCDCCGDRWYPKNGFFTEEGTEEPTVYGKSVSEELDRVNNIARSFGSTDGVPYIKIVYKDGTEQVFS